MRLVQTVLMVGIISFHLTLPGYADTETERRHIESAQGYANAGQWGYANREWRAALKENPESLDAHVGLGETLAQSGQAKEAVKHLREARKSIHKLSLDLAFGQALRQVGDTQQAADLYQEVLKQAPMNGAAFLKLVEILPELKEAQQQSVGSYLARRVLDASIKGRVALKEGNYAIAIESFGISTLYAPKSRDVNDYAVSLMLLGRYDEAMSQLGRMRELQPLDWQYYANMALINLGKGHPEVATGDVEQAIGLCAGSPQKPLLYNVLGFIYEGQGKWQKARNAYQRALELDPSFAKARLNLAYVYQKDQAYEEAITAYRDLLLREPNDISIWNRLGFVYELANKERPALQAYRQATRVAPDHPEAYYNLALLYRKLGKTREADLAYKNVMRIEFQQIESGSREPKALKVAGTGKQSGSNERNPKHRLLEYVDVFFSTSATNAAML